MIVPRWAIWAAAWKRRAAAMLAWPAKGKLVKL